MAIDPVCGMTVDEKTAPASAVHNGTRYYFCAPGCKRTFEKDPEAVLKGGARGMGHAPGPIVTMTPLRAKAADQRPGKNQITEAGENPGPKNPNQRKARALIGRQNEPRVWGGPRGSP